jgi:hypothetical protein
LERIAAIAREEAERLRIAKEEEERQAAEEANRKSAVNHRSSSSSSSTEGEKNKVVEPVEPMLPNLVEQKEERVQ